MLFFYFNNFEWSLVITAGGLLLKVSATMYRCLAGSDEAKYLAGRILKYLCAETKKGCTKQPEEITCDYMFQWRLTVAIPMFNSAATFDWLIPDALRRCIDSVSALGLPQ